MRTMRLSTRRTARGERTSTAIDPEAFGLTCGAMWGLGLFALTWWLIALDGPSKKPTSLGRVYRGYTISPEGSVLGLLWGFFDALLGGVVFAWLYNWLAARHE
jgi:hypothetical protein